ncbi:MAG: ADP-glyceromanno-heptose 6-epimerase [Planctomycetota bacterium]|nr:ADP-glyceromanno-heptose 6-epimerase [Planctomycetota bacterium]
MIIVTGAAGFIGSCLVRALNELGRQDLLLVDNDFAGKKSLNLENKSVAEKLQHHELHHWIEEHHSSVDFVYHLGARTDTICRDPEVFDRLNLSFSKDLWTQCVDYNLPIVYASSAATYGLGEHGFEDRHELVPKLAPLNQYARSKNEFDRWVLRQSAVPPFWAGLKFFNVYGPNEYHTGPMASVVFHTFRQIQENGVMRLFKSHHPEYKDGEQRRDFVYVKDVVSICTHFLSRDVQSGLYNVGTGISRTFKDLVDATFCALARDPKVEFVDTPESIREHYQYRTEASVEKLRSIGYDHEFFSLEAGVSDYVQNYLASGSYH